MNINFQLAVWSAVHQAIRIARARVRVCACVRARARVCLVCVWVDVWVDAYIDNSLV